MTHWKLCQNHKVKCGSQSEIILWGIPWSLVISLQYKFANQSKESILQISRKWANLISRSTIIQITSWPLRGLGNPTMKFIVMCSHFHLGTIIFWSNLASQRCFTLIYWQTRHRAMQPTMSLFISLHQKARFKTLYIRVPPGWIKNLDRCASWSSSSLIRCISRTHSLPQNWRVPSESREKSIFAPDSNSWPLNLRYWSWIYESLISSTNGDLAIKDTSTPLEVYPSSNKPIFKNCLVSLVITTLHRANIPQDFLLNASATTLPFPRW